MEGYLRLAPDLYMHVNTHTHHRADHDAGVYVPRLLEQTKVGSPTSYGRLLNDVFRMTAGRPGDCAQLSLLDSAPPAQAKVSHWELVCEHPGTPLKGTAVLFIIGNCCTESQVFSCNKALCL